MTKAADVADFFIELAQSDENDTITNLRINKLLYFAQAWYMARFDKPLFEEDFEAWDLGPVIPSIYKKYKENGKNNIDYVSDSYNVNNFNDDELNTLIDVFNYYGKYSTTELVNKTHDNGTPWKQLYKRGGNHLIPKECIKEFFKKQSPLDTFHIPTWMYDEAESGHRMPDGTLVIPKGWDDDDAE